MKEATVSKGPTVHILDTAIPEPNDDQVLIKVIVTGTNPKDWKVPEWMGSNINQGDDIAGVVEKVGANVTEFKPGDRVAAFHEMRSPHGSYAEYAIAWAYTTFHIPAKTSFEEAASIPLAAMTAALGMYIRLGLPEPWHPAKEPLPLIIYGAASAVGYYAIQLAQRSNIHPLICVAGRARDHVESAIDRSKGDTIIDYRDGDEAVVEGFKKALGQEGLPPLMHAFDAVSEKGSYVNICQVLPKGGKITLVLPGRDYKEIPEGIEQSITSVGSVHNQSEGEKDFGFLFFRYFSRGLEKGWFKPQRHEVVPGGLGGLQGALKNLMDGKASGVKYVLRIAETEGVSR